MLRLFQSFCILALGASLSTGQAITIAAIQSTGWNSSFELSPEQSKPAKLTTDLSAIVNTITSFDRTQLANGGAHEDNFYDVQSLHKDEWPTEPGKVIRLQEFTDPSPFSIPAKTAMSRIVYSTTNANGTLIPASAYVLWPFHAKRLRGQNGTAASSSAPVVLWTHGTSGWYANGAPSTHRGLFYADIVPFALAEAGYAVVAPDYAGLGVDASWDGTFIPHQYGIREAGAHDALNALRAAYRSFPTILSPNYVVMGHSQGGAIAWGLSEVLARNDSEFTDVARGHLGAVIAAPPTATLSVTAPGFLAWIGKSLDSIFPTFNISYWFTPLGVSRIELLNQIEGSQMVTFALLGDAEAEFVQPDWNETWYADAFSQLANPGRLPFRGPILLVQGTEDSTVQYNITKITVEETCKRYPGDLELLAVAQGGHFSVLNAAKHTYLQWIEDRFEHRPLANRGCIETKLDSLLPPENYQPFPNSFPMWAGESQWAYEVPTAL
ncbi:putative secretory lipase [Aspergillus homomorphus CBS 101889]|uniref:Putative secretory lipase n=1 Tax=Aspergillus homomorphus (strain CBS 101889) TaxID=1450537 RepID=A0A395I7I2_ASPHC|nr:putative secretory lipase [Aspergillus homomorphus CBS 101889]RAL16170.1 putative secretory lipase [Aspergillus homomorphus CBS 101889]